MNDQAREACAEAVRKMRQAGDTMATAFETTTTAASPTWGEMVKRWDSTREDFERKWDTMVRAPHTECVPIPMILHCPDCSARHVDVDDFTTKIHHTHSCQSCGLTWRPAVVSTVGVQFLPGFKDAAPVDNLALVEETRVMTITLTLHPLALAYLEATAEYLDANAKWNVVDPRVGERKAYAHLLRDKWQAAECQIWTDAPRPGPLPPEQQAKLNHDAYVALPVAGSGSGPTEVYARVPAHEPEPEARGEGCSRPFADVECPKCGRCTCPRGPTGRHLYSVMGCPLHGLGAQHAIGQVEPPPARPPSPDLPGFIVEEVIAWECDDLDIRDGETVIRDAFREYAARPDKYGGPTPARPERAPEPDEHDHQAAFMRELTSLLNRYSRENFSNTPDFILAAVASRALWVFEEAVNRREKWYGRDAPANAERDEGRKG